MTSWRKVAIGAVGLISFAAASGARQAMACPVCFGALEGPVADGMNKAILALLGITVGMLVCFAAFFVHLYRQARKVAMEANERVATGERTGSDDLERNVMEGTA